MNQIAKKILQSTGLCTALALTALMLLGTGMAGAQITYLGDGAIPNAAGGWNLPAQGTCPADPTQTTRPECVALRLNIAQGSCVAPNYGWTTGGVCNDTLATTEELCNGKPDRLWNAAPTGTNTCAIVMAGDDRNDVVCMMHNGTWATTGTCMGAWVMPTGGSYSPPVLTAAAGSAAGAGDQCLRCHNKVTQYNGPRVRDTEDTIYMGHKNMSRKVTAPMPWGGPPFACTGYPAATDEEICFENGGVWNPTIYLGTDSGQDFNWALGTVDIGPVGSPNPRSLYWIYADWLAAYPRAIYHSEPSTSKVCTNPVYSTQTACEGGGAQWVFNTGVSYSCARCHTTGWTADNTLQVTKEPHRSFIAQAPVGSNPTTTASIVWDRGQDAVAGQVSLSPGAPYNTTMASWDVWGISCTRCHSSAVDLSGGPCTLACSDAITCARATNSTSPGPGCGGTWNVGLAICEKPVGTAFPSYTFTSLPATCTAVAGSLVSGPPFPAPLGQSTHHNDLTGPTVSATGGYCTDPRFTAQTQCDAAGAAWLNACSIAGSCSNPAFTTSGTCFLGAGTWTPNNTTGLCATAGGTWSIPTGATCTVAGVCNDPAMLTSGTCTGTVVSGPLTGLVRQWKAATDIIRCEDAGGHYTGSKTNRGQIITGLCMNCHRQEASGVPMDATNPATAIKVGPYHGSVGFVSHPHANQFLNSPHAKFTGTFAQVPTGKNGSEYDSYFMEEGEAAKTGNGCTGCHDVHTSVVAGEKPFAEECTECHAKDLSSMIHSGGVGTPLEEMATDPMEACVICHMPAGEHLFRINVDPLYSTKPAGALTANVDANKAADGSYTDAVWVDLDSACGKCHGGGVANVETTGSIAANAATLTVATGQGANFTVGQRIEIAGAGAVYYEDGIGHPKNNEDFESYVLSISGDVVTLAGKATKTVTNAAVAQNPVKNNAAYFTKADLAVKAAGIHNDKPYVNFGYNLTPGNTLQLNVDASASNCSGSIANCNAFIWEWDDATTTTTYGPTATHLYATAGTKSVKLTVEEYGVSEGSVTKLIKIFAVDAPPVAGNLTNCVGIINPNTWVASLTDASTDNNGVKQVTVKWGDGGAISSATDNTPPYSLIGTVFSHTYLNPATVTIKQTAYDTIGQSNVLTCPAVTLSAFTISGNVRRLNNAPVAGAIVRIKLGTTTIRTLTTNALGNYTASNLKPGTYNVTATKTGLTFAQVYNQLVGPSAPGLNFQSAQ